MLTSLTLAAALITTTADASAPQQAIEPPVAPPPTGTFVPPHAGFSHLDNVPKPADSAANSTSSPTPEEVGPGEVSSDSECCQCNPYGCGAYGGYGGDGFNPPKMEHCWSGRCDMPQHSPYYPPAHGNYYFRPYSVAQLAKQQEFVVSWGGDPRDPYKNAIFQRVYDEMAAEKGESSADTPPAKTDDTQKKDIAAPDGTTRFVPITPKSLEYDEEARSIDGETRR